MDIEEDLEEFPNIHELFQAYNALYFGNQLGFTSIEWSTSRMTMCAGVCCYNPAGGEARIRLSEPLLKFRPVKDLKNTLLHEMIHALLFSTSNGKLDRDGHGPQFQAKMHEINRSTIFDPYRPPSGYDITVYHTMKDEVQLYRVHHWRCERCGDLIQRSMNRKPQPADCRGRRGKGDACADPYCHYHIHLRSCGGQYEKIAGPDLETAARGSGAGKGKGGKDGKKEGAPGKKVLTIEGAFAARGAKVGRAEDALDVASSSHAGSRKVGEVASTSKMGRGHAEGRRVSSGRDQGPKDAGPSQTLPITKFFKSGVQREEGKEAQIESTITERGMTQDEQQQQQQQQQQQKQRERCREAALRRSGQAPGACSVMPQQRPPGSQPEAFSEIVCIDLSSEDKDERNDLEAEADAAASRPRPCKIDGSSQGEVETVSLLPLQHQQYQQHQQHQRKGLLICPVCAADIRAPRGSQEEALQLLNAHLDECLARMGS